MKEDEEALPCAPKMSFDSKKQAQATATTTAWQRGSRPSVRPYKCNHCKLWHLASDYGV